MKYLSEVNLFQSLHTVLVLNRDLTGNLARICCITSSGKNPIFKQRQIFFKKITNPVEKIKKGTEICLPDGNLEDFFLFFNESSFDANGHFGNLKKKIEKDQILSKKLR